MAMKPSLTLRMSQQLRMTPQLQQAIRLLQLSTIDLQQEIQEALESNLMLEEVAPEDDSVEEIDAPEPVQNDDEEFEDPIVDSEETEFSDDAEEPVIPTDPEIDGEPVLDTSEEIVSEKMVDDLPVDTVWEDVWDEQPSYAPALTATPDDDENYLDNRNYETISIQGHLLDQLNLINQSDKDRLIAFTIIDALDHEGMLTLSVEELLSGFSEELEIEMDEVNAVLHLIQHLDPVGVAARDLSECLVIQLRQLPKDSKWRQHAIKIAEEHLNLLANRDYNQLIRKTRLKEQDLVEVVQLILRLNPKPGAQIAPGKTEYVDPDVLVTKQNGRWKVELNPNTAPRIRVNPGYAAMVKRADNSADNTYLRNHLQEARWFIKSLQQRNETLLKVTSKIVEYQRGFLEYGPEAMKPLVLHDIARAVDMHESTISRVTTQKYMRTPAGVFELKYFFSSHVGTHGGGEVSSTAIRALIKKLVSEESPRKPLSDNKIAALLAAQDIKVARRTIAKYRESLMIPPSNERKRLI